MNRNSFIVKVSLLLVFAFLLHAAAWAEPWSFGVISDTQWTVPDDGKNPNTVPADIIRQVDKEFIDRGVKLVIAVGDTVDKAAPTNIYTRALYAQDLYNAGIAFFPLRGNHEANTIDSGTSFAHAFPQIFDGGLNNATPDDITFNIIPAADLAANPPAKKIGSTFVVGANFSYPEAVNKANNSLSYSFDFGNARFVLLDQFDNTKHTNRSSIAQQQPWIEQRLSDPQRPPQAFVFGHKNLLGGGHKDNLFGNHKLIDPGDADPEQHPEQNAFIAALAKNHVHYYISGHDHHHYDSVVTSPDGKASVHQIISQSDSSKFYPARWPVSEHDCPISQDMGKIGYYIYTIDGPRVTVEYFGAPVSLKIDEIRTTPALTGKWQRMAVFGYSLNGKEFLVPQDKSYSVVSDSFGGTTAKILDGVNGSVAKTNYWKAWTKAVDTGWTAKADMAGNATLHSDVLTLWGLIELGEKSADPFVLQMSYDPDDLTPNQIKSSEFGLISPSADGKWRPAVEGNAGGTTLFKGESPAAAAGMDTLGQYGYDGSAHTVWAVVNHDGVFAAGLAPSSK